MEAVDLSNEIIKVFNNLYKKDATIKKLTKKVNGEYVNLTSYENANLYAEKLGELLGRSIEAVKDKLVEAQLQGLITSSFAQEIIQPILKIGYDRTSYICQVVQKYLNTQADISLNAVATKLNKDRIEGIITEMIDDDDMNHFVDLMRTQFTNFTMSNVDDSVKENSMFHYECGLKAKIIRKLGGGGHDGSCKWCLNLAGSYDVETLPKNSDVWKRHTDCTCQLIYVPSKASNEEQRKVW